MRNDPSRAHTFASPRATRGSRASLADAQSLRAPVCQSHHGCLRAAQRNLGMTDVEYIMLYGYIIHRTGALFYCLRAKDIPPAHRHLPRISRLVGAVVLTSREGEIITLYRNAGALRVIQRKMKYRLTPGGNSIHADMDEDDPVDEGSLTQAEADRAEPLRAIA